MERDDGLIGRVLMVVAVVFGLSTAGTLVSRSGGAAAPVVTAVPESPPSKPAPTAADGPIAPGGITRPLSLIADFVATVPMFEPDEQDRLVLSARYRSVLSAAPQATPPEPALVAEVRRLTRERGIELRFVVATLPDWVDSSLQWTFDPMLDAIQMAAAQMGYLPTAFQIPDADVVTQASGPGGAARARLRKLHETEPGALLFRRSSAERTELLLVLLVGETATAGVHPRALAAALDLMLLWQRGAQPGADHDGLRGDALRVLGPTYSGSAESLRTALGHTMQRHALPREAGRAWFDIVSPSATSPRNRDFLQLDGVSRFAATTRSDDEAMYALADFLGGTDPAWRCGKHVALLVEANTTWGRRFFEQRGVGPQSARALVGRVATSTELQHSACQRCTRAGTGAELEDPLMPCATVLPFPMHISRLRSEAAQHARPQGQLAVPSNATVSLQLGETGLPVDRLPSFSPVLTAANVETMLTGVFRAIEERGITAVGVLATDKRDHVFLAQEITRRTPNVLPFTLESNLIYLHPDVSSYVRGTVVASTYSLYDRTQFLTRPTLAYHFRQQFGSAAAHGAFNALSALLGEHAQMLDYDTPAGPGARVPDRGGDGPCKPGIASCTPPVWISVAARGALLPLTASPPSPHRDDGYALRATNTGTEREGRLQQDYLGEHLLFRSLLLALAALLLWHRWPRPERARIDFRDGRLEHEWRASRYACDSALIVLGLWLAKLAVISLADAQHRSPDVARPLYLGACALGLAWILWCALRAFWRTQASSPPRAWLALGAVPAYAAAIAAWCLLPGSGQRVTALGVAGVAAVCAVLLDARLDVDNAAPGGLWSVQRWRRVPVLLGLAAALCLVVDLARHAWQAVDAVLYVDRTAQLMSLVSPAPVIVLLCGSAYWWGAWNLRRLQLMWLPEIQVGVGELLFGRARRGGARPLLVFEAPTMTVGAFFVLPVLGAGFALLAGADRVGSIEGHAFGGFLWFGASCVLATTAHTLAHSMHLGQAVLGTLRALGRHPAAKQFELLGKEPFPWRLSFREPQIPEFELLVRRIQLCAATSRRCTAQDDALLAELGGPSRLQWQDLADGVVHAMKFDRNDPATGSHMRLEDWQRLDSLTRQFKAALRLTRWRAGFAMDACSPALQQATEHMEYVVLFHGCVILRDLLTRLVSGFTAVLGGLALLLGAHLFYTFQGRAFWLAIDWIAIGLAAAVAMRMLLGLERDVVLSRLWSTTPGRITAFGGLSWRMLLYFVVTLVALFSAFFPEVGGGIAKWLDPVRRFIP